MYMQVGTYQSGLARYRCLRGTREGYHAFLHACLIKCGKSASPRLLDAITREFDWRWTVNALRVRDIAPRGSRTTTRRWLICSSR